MAGSVVERHPFRPKIRRVHHDDTPFVAGIQHLHEPRQATTTAVSQGLNSGYHGALGGRVAAFLASGLSGSELDGPSVFSAIFAREC
jgi:hypothetical protein